MSLDYDYDAGYRDGTADAGAYMERRVAELEAELAVRAAYIAEVEGQRNQLYAALEAAPEPDPVNDSRAYCVWWRVTREEALR
jgi:hypothetical protein